MVRQKPAKLPFPSSNLGATFTPLTSNMLYLVATPIGNLSDFTFRAVETLKNCDYILCEDTRHSQTLLQHYEIKKPLKSYHKFNEAASEANIIADLQEGKKIALISDAGTPGISDPGARIVHLCVEMEIPVISIPGPCAAILALTQSGLSTDHFQFWGFLPKKEGELKTSLREILAFTGTTICYETPHRLLDVLQLIDQLDSQRRLVVCRELTKKFEESKRGTAKDLLDFWKSHTLKGEIVLLIEGTKNQLQDWSALSPQEHVQWLIDTFQVSKQEAVKIAAEMRGVPKREIYNTCITPTPNTNF